MQGAGIIGITLEDALQYRNSRLVITRSSDLNGLLPKLLRRADEQRLLVDIRQGASSNVRRIRGNAIRQEYEKRRDQ
jgi:hypothetical protein